MERENFKHEKLRLETEENEQQLRLETEKSTEIEKEKNTI